MTNKEKALNNFLLIDKNLSKYATPSLDAERFKYFDENEDIRTPFFRDVDRIIYSMSYTRYEDKTQVYSFPENDHVSKRMVHVQLVSKIARTIGRSLNLNCDLIEAIALGHDIGHTPLGHTGEKILNEITLRELNEFFAHNIQSVRNCMYIEKGGDGLNLCVQTLDGMMCHNGEILSPIYKPMKKDKEEVLREYEESYKDLKKSHTYAPMTLEGCVVRISDVVGYIGRDIDDAVSMGLFKKEDLPTEITEVLGNTNTEIVNTLILDIIENSMDKPYIKMSDDVFNALFKLKEFNYKYIYSKAMSGEEYDYYKTGMNKIFNKYLNDINNKNYDSEIYNMFLNNQKEEYLKSTNPKRQVVDFIAGMTDEMLKREIEKN